MFKKFFVLILLIASLFSFTGCTTEEIYNVQGTELSVSYFYIPRQEWTWNPATNRYEAFRPIPALDSFIFDEGAIVGSVFIKEGNKEVQQILPFVHTYFDYGVPYTETISMDVSARPNQVRFFIQTSDLFEDDRFLQDYEFKVSLLWNEP